MRRADPKSSFRAKTSLKLDDIISTTRWSSGVTVSRGNSPFFQQPHELSHSVGHHNLSISLHKDIKFGIFAGLRLLPGAVEATFRRDRSSCRFQDFSNVSPIGDCPTSFFYPQVSVMPLIRRKERKTYEGSR